MSKLIRVSAVSAAIFAFSAMSSFAASALSSGGIGQPAANPQQFVVTFCNRGTETINIAAPIDISANGKKVRINSEPPIKPGECEFDFVRYSKLNMQGGKSYSVIVSTGKEQATYSVSVPAQTAPTAKTPISAVLNMNASGAANSPAIAQNQNPQAQAPASSQYSADLVSKLNYLLEELNKLLKNR